MEKAFKVVGFRVDAGLEGVIRRDWGYHYKHQSFFDKSLRQFEKSIELKSAEFESYLQSSFCESQQLRLDNALDHAKSALNLEPKRLDAQLNFSNCLLELNQLEETFKTSYNTFLQYPREGNLKDSLEFTLNKLVGPVAGKVLRKYDIRSKLEHVGQKLEHEKQLKNQNDDNCDVVSDDEDAANEKVSPLTIFNAKRYENLKHDTYFDRSFSEQYNFWKQMQNDNCMYLHNTPHSSEEIKENVDRIVDNLDICETMLYVREPFYVKSLEADKHFKAKLKQRKLFNEQENVREKAFWQLKEIKYLSKINFQLTLDLVEDAMVNFYAVKSRKIFIRKFEFINEIFNFIGLEYLNRMRTIHPKLMEYGIEQRLDILFQTPITEKKEIKKPETNVEHFIKFGQNAIKDQKVSTKADTKEVALFKKIHYFRHRLIYAEFDIEKTYLYQQLAELFFNSGRYDESQQSSRDSLKYATNSKNSLWKYLSYLNIIRVDTVKRNYTRVERNLNKLKRVGDDLDELSRVFVRTAIRTVDDIEEMFSLRRSAASTKASSRANSIKSDNLSSRKPSTSSKDVNE